MDDFLSVKPGDPITSDIWNKLLKSVDRSQILLGGENVRTHQTPHGTLLNAKHIAGWNHPWRVFVSQTMASVYPGLINGQVPTINGKPMTDRPAPLIKLSDDLFSSNGVGWIALQLTVDKDPKDESDHPNLYAIIKTAEIIQCKFITGSEKNTTNPFFYFGFPGIGNFQVRYPLARLHQITKGQVNVFPVAMFNLNWKAKQPQPSGGGTGGTAIGSAFPRHFFWAA